MPFSVEDILQEFAEATSQGKREHLDGNGYSFIRPRHKSWMLPEEYRAWLRQAEIATRKWRAANKEKVKATSAKYRRQEKYLAWVRQYRKACRRKRPAQAHAADKRKQERIKADPVRRKQKRKWDREAKRRERARKKNGLQR